MEVDDSDLDAFETASRAQLRARELGKFEALIPNLRPSAPVREAMGKSSHEMLYENLNTANHPLAV